MKKVLISGEITVETTLKVEGFPVNYQPVQFPFHAMESSVAGVGINQSRAFAALGVPTTVLGLIGQDLRGGMIRAGLAHHGIDDTYILPRLEKSTQSLILYDPNGKRMIWNDLKDIQDQTYPVDQFRLAAAGSRAAVLCNLNFNRPLLAEARSLGQPVFTDVHVLGDLHDPYNREFMQAATVLFLSNENFPGRERDFVRQLAEIYPFQMAVVGMGAEGALLFDRSADMWHQSPAWTPRPVVSTIGAGDALAACFTQGWLDGLPPARALDRACRFAGYKVGSAGAADGFPGPEQF